MPEKKEELTVRIRRVNGQCEAKPGFVAKPESIVFFDLEPSIRDKTIITFVGPSPFEKPVRHGQNKVKRGAAEGHVEYIVKWTDQPGDGNGSGEVISGP
jgi:hypothetical protein